ncbi:hypothetical protein QQ045_004583 [Rhodiola kirilowii]
MFVYGLTGLENMGFVANMASMVIYFLYKMYFDLSTAANTLTNFMGSTFLLSLLGAFISDAYLNRLHTTLIFGFLECVGLAMLTIQARYKSLLPEYCGKSSCVEGGVALMLYASLGLYAVGSGGVKGALAPHGADQFDQKNPKEAKALATYFNWLLLSTVLGASIGVTFIVWVSMNKAWYWGFFISLLGALAGYILLAVGTPFYHIQVPSGSPLTKIVQVIVVSFKNRKLTLPKDSSELYEISERNSKPSYIKVLHTDQFRWMDKAAIVQDTEKTRDPWKLCTVSEIEEVKVLTRMLPIIGSTIIMNTCLAQLQTFSMEQGSRMNLYLGSWAIPAPSIPIIPLLFLLILIPLYDCYFVPFARKFTGHPTGITQLQRVGVGLVLSAISMCAAGFVEVKRRNAANSFPPFKISLFWLSFQFGIFGIADMFTLVGLLEFFYREAPAGMRSLSTSFTWISLSFGYFLSSLFVSLINTVTGKFAADKQGWLHGQDLNKNKLNLFYWFLSVLSVLNFFNYLYWATWYKYKEIDTGAEKFIAADDHKSFEAPVGLKPEGEKDAVAKVEEEVTGKNDKEKEQEH